MDDAQVVRVRRHMAGWEHRGGQLVAVFTMQRADVLPFLGDIATAEDTSAYYAAYTVTQDAVEITIGGSSSDGSVTDIEYLLALRISAAAAARGVHLLGS